MTSGTSAFLSSRAEMSQTITAGIWTEQKVIVNECGEIEIITIDLRDQIEKIIDEKDGEIPEEATVEKDVTNEENTADQEGEAESSQGSSDEAVQPDNNVAGETNVEELPLEVVDEDPGVLEETIVDEDEGTEISKENNEDPLGEVDGFEDTSEETESNEETVDDDTEKQENVDEIAQDESEKEADSIEHKENECGNKDVELEENENNGVDEGQCTSEKESLTEKKDEKVEGECKKDKEPETGDEKDKVVEDSEVTDPGENAEVKDGVSPDTATGVYDGSSDESRKESEGGNEQGATSPTDKNPVKDQTPANKEDENATVIEQKQKVEGEADEKEKQNAEGNETGDEVGQ